MDNLAEQTPELDIHYGDNLSIMRGFERELFDLIYVDPPFNTGKTQTRAQISTAKDREGDRVGFKGQTYRTTVLGTKGFDDRYDDYIEFLRPRIEETHRLLASNGSFFLHLDSREIHYAKVLCDEIFGRASFINDIIWHYDYGGGVKKSGRQSMTTSSGMPKIRRTTRSDMRLLIESLIWLPS